MKIYKQALQGLSEVIVPQGADQMFCTDTDVYFLFLTDDTVNPVVVAGMEEITQEEYEAVGGFLSVSATPTLEEKLDALGKMVVQLALK